MGASPINSIFSAQLTSCESAILSRLLPAAVSAAAGIVVPLPEDEVLGPNEATHKATTDETKNYLSLAASLASTCRVCKATPTSSSASHSCRLGPLVGDDHHQICRRLGVCLFSTHVPCGGIDRVRTPLATLTSGISLSPVLLPVWQQQRRQLINHKQMVCVRMWHRGGSFWCVRCQLLPSLFFYFCTPHVPTQGALCVCGLSHTLHS